MFSGSTPKQTSFFFFWKWFVSPLSPCFPGHPYLADNLLLGAAGHLFHRYSQPPRGTVAWFPSFTRLLEVVALTKPLSSLGHLRKISKNCSNSLAESLQLLREVSHLYTWENFHYLFSALHTISAKKRKLQRSSVFISGISTWSLDAVAISLIYSQSSFQRVINQKNLSFGFSASHITSGFIAVCSFLTLPLLPNKNQPLA